VDGGGHGTLRLRAITVGARGAVLMVRHAPRSGNKSSQEPTTWTCLPASAPDPTTTSTTTSNRRVLYTRDEPPRLSNCNAPPRLYTSNAPPRFYISPAPPRPLHQR